MYHDFFVKSPLLAFPLVALVIFIAVFALVVLRAFGKATRELAKTAVNLPLEDDYVPALARVPARSPSHQESRHE